MPRSGSHTYDLERSRQRRLLEEQGVGDDEAEDRAARAVADDSTEPGLGGTSERARGPYGEHGGGGDPGAVLTLRSPSFSDNTLIPRRHSRADENVSPVLCEDRDGPEGGQIHWLVTGIDPGITSIAEGSVPAGAVAWPNAFGEEGYAGPHPPADHEPHRYFFRVFALEAPLVMDPSASIEDVYRNVDDRRIASGTLIGRFVR
jgi:Raf kinase inhibitor-like YbhB/YbcL family protein